MKISFLLILIFLWGCSSGGAKPDASTEIKHQEVSPLHQQGLVAQQTNKKELVAMLCPTAKLSQAKLLWQQQNLALVKQSSPTILTLSWSDSRSIAQVIQSLQTSDAVFCGIESNQTYKAVKQ